MNGNIACGHGKAVAGNGLAIDAIHRLITDREVVATELDNQALTAIIISVLGKNVVVSGNPADGVVALQPADAHFVVAEGNGAGQARTRLIAR